VVLNHRKEGGLYILAKIYRVDFLLNVMEKGFSPQEAKRIIENRTFLTRLFGIPEKKLLEIFTEYLKLVKADPNKRGDLIILYTGSVPTKFIDKTGFGKGYVWIGSYHQGSDLY
jgi:hypothetical protein